MRRRAIRPVKDLVKTEDSSSQDMTKVNNLRSNPQDETSYIHDEKRTDQVDKGDEACVKVNVHIRTVGKDYISSHVSGHVIKKGTGV